MTLPTDTRVKSVLLAKARGWDIASDGVGIYPTGDAQLLVTRPDFIRAGDGMAGVTDLYDAPMELSWEMVNWAVDCGEHQVSVRISKWMMDWDREQNPWIYLWARPPAEAIAAILD